MVHPDERSPMWALLAVALAMLVALSTVVVPMTLGLVRRRR